MEKKSSSGTRAPSSAKSTLSLSRKVTSKSLVSINVKINVSEETLLDFQFDNRTEHTYVRHEIEISEDYFSQSFDKYDYFISKNLLRPKISVTMPYEKSEDGIADLCRQAENDYKKQLLIEVGVVKSFNKLNTEEYIEYILRNGLNVIDEIDQIADFDDLNEIKWSRICVKRLTPFLSDMGVDITLRNSIDFNCIETGRLNPWLCFSPRSSTNYNYIYSEYGLELSRDYFKRDISSVVLKNIKALRYRKAPWKPEYKRGPNGGATISAESKANMDFSFGLNKYFKLYEENEKINSLYNALLSVERDLSDKIGAFEQHVLEEEKAAKNEKLSALRDAILSIYDDKKLSLAVKHGKLTVDLLRSSIVDNLAKDIDSFVSQNIQDLLHVKEYKLHVNATFLDPDDRSGIPDTYLVLASDFDPLPREVLGDDYYCSSRSSFFDTKSKTPNLLSLTLIDWLKVKIGKISDIAKKDVLNSDFNILLKTLCYKDRAKFSIQSNNNGASFFVKHQSIDPTAVIIDDIELGGIISSIEIYVDIDDSSYSEDKGGEA